MFGSATIVILIAASAFVKLRQLVNSSDPVDREMFAVDPFNQVSLLNQPNTQPGGPRIVALNRDLFFGIRLKQLGSALGYQVDLIADAGSFLTKLREGNVALGIVDIGAGPDWSAIAADAELGPRPPILAFGAHKDADGLRAAKQAGVTRVVSNGQFHRDAASLIRRYADRSSGAPAGDEGTEALEQ